MKTEVIPSYAAGQEGLRANLRQALPPESLKAFDEYGEKLGASLHPILKLKTGDVAPPFSLTNALNQTVSLSSLLKKGKVVLVFYRGGWCPYCNLQLNHLQQVLDQITEAGATLVAISPQTPDASLSFAEKNNLKFEVLSDVGNGVANMYTTVFHHAADATAVLNGLGIDFGNFYGDDSDELPVPAAFVIDQNGKILLAKTAGGDFRNRVEPSEILQILSSK
jgi:peroxiredoxin